jgi:hypothetical protein
LESLLELGDNHEWAALDHELANEVSRIDSERNDGAERVATARRYAGHPDFEGDPYDIYHKEATSLGIKAFCSALRLRNKYKLGNSGGSDVEAAIKHLRSERERKA